MKPIAYIFLSLISLNTFAQSATVKCEVSDSASNEVYLTVEANCHDSTQVEKKIEGTFDHSFGTFALLIDQRNNTLTYKTTIGTPEKKSHNIYIKSFDQETKYQLDKFDGFVQTVEDLKIVCHKK